jgi:hypothetical protein
MKNRNYKHGYNSQDEYDYYNRQSRQDIAEIAAICFALLFVMIVFAGMYYLGEKIW